MPIKSPGGTTISRERDADAVAISAPLARTLAAEGVIDVECSVNFAPAHEVLMELVERVQGVALIAEPFEAWEVDAHEVEWGEIRIVGVRGWASWTAYRAYVEPLRRAFPPDDEADPGCGDRARIDLWWD